VDIEGREESTNVEDRRGGGGTRTGLAITGVGGIIVVILGLVFGFDPRPFLGMGGGAPPDRPRAVDPSEDKVAHFTKVVFRDTEVVWDNLFARKGKRYEKPVLVLFTGQVDSACGRAEAAVGPFYCPADSRVYIDLSFYRDMERQLDSPGDFARAYVVAHEVGHHVQKLLGYPRPSDRVRGGRDSVEAHHQSVRLELQADYLAGVWAHHGQEKFHFLRTGDLDSALNAAYQIGDDRLQKKARGRVVPDSFTHGRSDQRQRWFRKGFDTGDVDGAAALFDLPYDNL
jgi:predicted metalloprotease